LKQPEALSVVLDLIDELTERAIAAERRIAELEARKPEQGPVGEKGDTGEPGERGADGVSPEPEAIAAALLPIAEEMIVTAITKAVAELPKPERGEKGEPGERGEKGEPGSDGLNGKDGAGIVDGFLSREGHLIATLSDGTTRDFGEVVGKDGRDGANGKDGRDGIELSSFDAIVLDDDRTVELKFISGEEERVASFKWPTVLDRGVYKAGEQYDAGDAVTWGGSLWIAQRATDQKPDTPDSGFRLAVKRGRDGKDAKVG
jgi:integrin beta 3